ncbi:hypothetical protein ACOM2C_14410 [Pseudarthrobacter sp. So.54]
MVQITNWLGLTAGVPVMVRRPGHTPAVATVDLMTPDGNILWVRYWNSAERAMLHKTDGTQVWGETENA